ncbi:MAG: 2-oxoacid ferredoxin oxidoreductase, partial [Deltaproteobacteria bacterium]|nr:2-oxoacid ferredoxin oxidoreductase [Deltaproteobacteria bacterium]
MVELKDFDNGVDSQWCPGCSNFAILQAEKRAFVELGIMPHELCLVSGIGQAAKLPHYLNCNFFNGLHGRPIPVATAIKTVNPALAVVVNTGDGDCYGEGGNHFLHAIRRNPDITLIVHNNFLYALTKGQASPTTPQDAKRSLQVRGVKLLPFEPITTAIALGCTFVARGFAGDFKALSSLVVQAVRHRGL